jgi:hypothetical protein
LYEVVPHEEDRSVWRTKLEAGDFEAALKYAKVSESGRAPGVKRDSASITHLTHFPASARTPSSEISSNQDWRMRSLIHKSIFKLLRRTPSAREVLNSWHSGLWMRMKRTD